MPDARATHDWQVAPKLLTTIHGVALVRIAVHHAGVRLFHFGVRLERPDGAGADEMEVGALALFGTSMQALAEECRLEMLTRTNVE